MFHIPYPLRLPLWNANNSSTLKDPKLDALDLGLGLDDVILQGLRKDAESDLLLVGNVLWFCWSDRNMTLPWNMIPNMLKSSLICRFPAQILTLDFLYCNVRPPLHSSRVSLRFAAFLPAAPPTTSAFICCQLSVVFCWFLCSCLIQVTLTSQRPHLAPAALCAHPGLVKCVKY